MRFLRTPLQPLLAFALALPLLPLTAHAETLEGTLELGHEYSVLWEVSPESGDLIGQVFANASPVGQSILSHCSPDTPCVLRQARTTEPPDWLTKQLSFSAHPSGWWVIEHAHSVHGTRSAHASAASAAQAAQLAAEQAVAAALADAQTQAESKLPRTDSNLPMRQNELQTRYGLLSIDAAHVLHLQGYPVLDAKASDQAGTETSSAPTWRAQFSQMTRNWGAWLQAQWNTLRHRMSALLGNDTEPLVALDSATTPPTTHATPADAATANPSPAPLPPTGTAQVVQGNVALHIVAHLSHDTDDTILLQSTGGTACPSRFRFATLNREGIHITPEFGTCSAVATLGGTSHEPSLSMPGFLGPFEPAPAREQAAQETHTMTLRQGRVHTSQAPNDSDQGHR